jgi:hypothetical protein
VVCVGSHDWVGPALPRQRSTSSCVHIAVTVSGPFQMSMATATIINPLSQLSVLAFPKKHTQCVRIMIHRRFWTASAVYKSSSSTRHVSLSALLSRRIHVVLAQSERGVCTNMSMPWPRHVEARQSQWYTMLLTRLRSAMCYTWKEVSVKWDPPKSHL